MKYLTTILAIALASAATTTALHAQSADYYWWVSGNPTPGGTAVWNITTQNWSDEAGSYRGILWPNTQDVPAVIDPPTSATYRNNAIFTGSGGTVTFNLTAIYIDTFQIDAPDYIFNIASTGRTFYVNQFAGTSLASATFTGSASLAFSINIGESATNIRATTLSATINVPTLSLYVGRWAQLTLSSANNITGTVTLGQPGTLGAPTGDGEVVLNNVGALGTAKLVTAGGTYGESIITSAVPIFEFVNGVSFGGNRNVAFNSSTGIEKFLFSNLTATNSSTDMSGNAMFFNAAETKLTGVGNAAGAITMNNTNDATRRDFIIAGTGKVILNIALMQGRTSTIGDGNSLIFNNTNEVLLTDAMAASTYTGPFAISNWNYSPSDSVVRTTTLNNKNEKGVFGNSAFPIYLTGMINSLTALNARAKLIYDSDTDGSTNKDISIGGQANGTSYATLASEGTGRFEITGIIGGHINASYSSRYLTLTGDGNGRIGPAAGDLTGTTGIIYNVLPGGSHGSRNDNAMIHLTKEGTGTWVLEGNNTYTGKTIVSTGTLLLNGNNTDVTFSGNPVGTGTDYATGYGINSSGHYLVEAGGTLGGGGTWDVDTQKYVGGYIKGFNNTNNSNLILVQSGGFLAPGRAIGQVGVLTIDAAGLVGGTTFSSIRVLRMADGAKFAFDLSGSVADRIDFWNVSNASLITFGGAAINLTLSGNVAEGDYEAVVFLFYSDSGSNVMIKPFSSGLTIGTLGDRIENAIINYNPDSISISYTVLAIPEPATWALLGASLLVVTLFRRKKI